MRFFHHMKIGARLAWGFGAVLSLVLLVSALSWLGLRVTNTEVDLVLQDRYPKVKQVHQIQAELNLQARIVGDLVFVEDLQIRRDELAALDTSRAKASDLYQALHTTIHSERGKALLTQAEAAFRIHKDELRVRPIWRGISARAVSKLASISRISAIQGQGPPPWDTK